MPRRPAPVARVLARPRVAVAAALAAAIVLLGLTAAVAAVIGPGSGPALDARAGDVGAARVAPATTAPPTTTSTTTTAAPTTTVPPTTTSPATTSPPTTAFVLPPLPSLPNEPPVQPESPPAAPSGVRCLVRLHGKGGNGASNTGAGGVITISPAGNAPGWGGRQWTYADGGSYASAIASVAQGIDAAGCGQVIVDGFSNGGAFAVKLYCRGETFGGRLVRVVADDPVPDHGADGCAPGGAVSLTIYWTGALAATATPGWSCAQQDWTCEGGATVGIDAYAANAGAAVKASPYTSHQWYMDAPELTAFG